LARLRKVRSEGQFTPLSFDGTVVFPGTDGGAEWGGAAFDPKTRLLYVNSNDIPYILRLIPRPTATPKTNSRKLYLQSCANCHREDLTGAPPDVPSLTSLGRQYTDFEIASVIRDGIGRMPSFRHLGEQNISALARYLSFGEEVDIHQKNQSSAPTELKYTNDGYHKFLDPQGYPAVEPPWGTLNAISLDSGQIVWRIPFGQFPELVKQGSPDTGSENYGGPVVTAGGLLFISATNRDKKFRAFDKSTGKLLWETLLPAAGNATPSVYEVDGRQFVVIAAGGRGRANGGTYVAFALPKEHF
jgi:quinoprotein glucose dehydrogenase